jgi:predicted transcriptional regulator
MEERIDQWIARQDKGDLGRHEAIRRLLDIALKAEMPAKRKGKPGI